MATDKSDRLLARLEESKRRFGPGEAARAEKAIAAAGKVRFRDAQSLIRFHDALLFLRAFPQGPGVVRISEALLAGLHARVEQLRASGADMSAFDDESVSGIAGIEIVDTFPYEIAAWLAQSYPKHVEICWDADINSARLANTWPRFMPLLDEDGFVEPDVPYREWLDAARGNEPEVAWLLRRFASLNMPERGQAELYESLQLPVQWNLGELPASRTLARRDSRPTFFHREPLIRRGDVSLARELASPLSLETLSPGESADIINMGREVLTVRYRGLYGMTFRSAAGLSRRGRARHADFYLGTSAQPAFPSAHLRCGIHAQERNPDQLPGSDRTRRLDGNRLQHFLCLSRRRDGLDLRPGAARPPPTARHGHDFRVPVPAWR